MREGIRFILIFVFCFLIQILVLSNIQIGYWFHPFIYLFFLIYLPPNIPKWMSVASFFLVGFLYDIFLNSYGIHASACLVLGLLKPYITRVAVRQSPAREGEESSWLNQTKKNFKYIFLISFILLHHLWVFTFETLGSGFFTIVLPTWIVSSIVSFILILLSEELFYKTFASKS